MRKKYPLVAFDVTDPKTMKERRQVAQRCRVGSQLDIMRGALSLEKVPLM